MMPQHFLMVLEERQPENVILANGKVVITKPYKTWLSDQKVVFESETGLRLDLAIVEITEAHRGCDITNHFATLEDLAKLKDRKFQATISGLDLEHGIPTNTSAGGDCTLLAEDKTIDYNIDHPDRTETVQTYSVALHRIPTKPGDCGKVISVNTDALSGRVFGIHIMGNANGHNHARSFPAKKFLTQSPASPTPHSVPMVSTTFSHQTIPSTPGSSTSAELPSPYHKQHAQV